MQFYLPPLASVSNQTLLHTLGSHIYLVSILSICLSFYINKNHKGNASNVAIYRLPTRSFDESSKTSFESFFHYLSRIFKLQQNRQGNTFI